MTQKPLFFFQYQWILAAFLAGALYALGFPTKNEFHVFLLPIIGFAVYFHLLKVLQKDGETFLKSLLITICFASGFNLVGFYWIPHTLYEFGGLSAPWNYLLSLLFALVIVPQLYLFLIFLTLIKHKIPTWFHWLRLRPTRFYITLALFLTLAEYFTPQQFPAHIGHSWLQLAPFLGLAPILGAPIFSFISFWLALELVALFYRRPVKIYFTVSLFIFLIFNFSQKLEKYPHNPQDEVTHNIRFVQANIGNLMKLSSEAGHVTSVAEVYQRFYQMSIQESEKFDHIDLIIWPETAFPHMMNSQKLKSSPSEIPDIIKDITSTMNAELFIGGYDENPQAANYYFEREYNTAFHFAANGSLKNVYHKQILIPFGEGLPFGPFNQFLSQYITNISYFAKGQTNTLFTSSKGAHFMAAICYEVLFSSFFRDYLNSIPQEKRPQFIINLTNDSWYGDTAEPLQHLFLAKWRALEFQMPILRMTNTGITSVIYPNGQESKRLGVFQQDILDYQLTTATINPTLFQKWGIFLTVLVALALITLVTLISSRAKSPLLRDHAA